MRVVLMILCLAGTFLFSLGQNKRTEKDGYVWYLHESDNNKEWVTDTSGKTIVPKDSWFLIMYQERNGYKYFEACKEIANEEYRCAIYSLNGDLLIPASRYSSAWLNEDGTFTGAGGSANGYETIKVDVSKLKAINEWIKPVNMADLLFLFSYEWEEDGDTYEFNLDNDKINVRYTTPVDPLGVLFGMDLGPTVIKGSLKVVIDEPSLGFIEWETKYKQPFNIIGISEDRKKFKLDDERIFIRKD